MISKESSHELNKKEKTEEGVVVRIAKSVIDLYYYNYMIFFTISIISISWIDTLTVSILVIILDNVQVRIRIKVIVLTIFNVGTICLTISNSY